MRNNTISKTAKLCLTAVCITWIAAVTLLSLLGQPEIGVTLAFAGAFAAAVLLFAV